MFCQRCKKNEATVHIKQNVNGVKKELILCSECAEKEGIQPFFKDDLFSGFFSDSILGVRRAEDQKRCTSCGLTRRELASSGRPGCAKCYEVFSDELEKQKQLDALKKEIEALKKEQQEAIAEQNYEKAAELRDKIKALTENGGDR